MDKLCDECRALTFSYPLLRKNENVYTQILLNQQDDHDECVKVLLKAGADVNVEKPYNKGTALVQAARQGHVTRLQALINAGADVNKHCGVPSRYHSCQNALTHAVSEGNIECVELLIKGGAHVNKVGLRDISILRLAVQNDNVTCADLLIKAGAHVNVGYNYTPLYYAVTQKANRCIDLLLKAGADVNNAGVSAGTVLMYVQDEECCKKLLKHHSQINRRDNYGDNALTKYIRAANPVNKDLCSLLFAAGETVPQTVTKWFPAGAVNIINAVDYLPQIAIYFYLMELCREAIRNHLLKLDRHTNLFDRIPRLGLPKPLVKYLLFDTSLDPSSAPGH